MEEWKRRKKCLERCQKHSPACFHKTRSVESCLREWNTILLQCCSQFYCIYIFIYTLLPLQLLSYCNKYIYFFSVQCVVSFLENYNLLYWWSHWVLVCLRNSATHPNDQKGYKLCDVHCLAFIINWIKCNIERFDAAGWWNEGLQHRASYKSYWREPWPLCLRDWQVYNRTNGGSASLHENDGSIVNEFA